ncbi:redoxin domain-containing protein [Arthrobacter sp. H5]|uniref:redoxin domain-containing protein n=1 Tax=Arthrobacter sp. H5 TaxID=1267973 RepID=UPI0004B81F4C|nr:redoxin domain-containing protein [Arthrobacter sp. H5]
MEEILLSTTILASFLGGMVVLLAPCCVSVMLPAFFATTFRRKTQILAMTLVFAAGVGTIILPIAFGAAALSRLLIDYHTPVFTIGGLAMMVMGGLILAGRKIMLPMIVRGGSGGSTIRSVYALGAFSGAASACCAPVLAGVAAVSGAASSFPAALAVGVAPKGIPLMGPTKTSESPRKNTSRPLKIWVLVAVVVAAVVGLFLVYQGSTDPEPGPAQMRAEGVDYDVGSPGTGSEAPAFTLPSVEGGPVELGDYSGKSTLLYFHERLGCQPCWDQIKDLEENPSVLQEAGIDSLVTITSGPADLIARKMSDDGLETVALADTDLTVSRQYEANKFGMMGESSNGHTFILVGPEGTIQWRADYGGAPDYTMYVPVTQLMNDLEAGRAG